MPNDEPKNKRRPPNLTVEGHLDAAVEHLDAATERLTSDKELRLIHRTLLKFLTEVRL